MDFHAKQFTALNTDLFKAFLMLEYWAKMYGESDIIVIVLSPTGPVHQHQRTAKSGIQHS